MQPAIEISEEPELPHAEDRDRHLHQRRDQHERRVAPEPVLRLEQTRRHASQLRQDRCRARQEQHRLELRVGAGEPAGDGGGDEKGRHRQEQRGRPDRVADRVGPGGVPAGPQQRHVADERRVQAERVVSEDFGDHGRQSEHPVVRGGEEQRGDEAIGMPAASAY